MKLKYVDSTHAYYLDGKRCKNVTSVAKIPEDTFRLEQWSQRQVAIGLTLKPSLLEQIAANVDNNQKVNEICEAAAAEAGAHEGRDRGDALHKALEQFDTGKRFIPTDLTSTAIKSWEHILEEQHWHVDLIERCVIWDDEMIAGRFDRTVRGDPCPTCGNRIYIVDYKSGAKVLNYPHAISCQLTLYANAPLISGPIPGDGGETEDIAPFEGVCKCHGYVVHLPPDADAQLIEIDLALDVVTDIIFPTINWRKRPAKSLARIVTAVEAKPAFLDALATSKDAYIDVDPFAGLPGTAPAPVLNPFHERKTDEAGTTRDASDPWGARSETGDTTADGAVVDRAAQRVDTGEQDARRRDRRQDLGIRQDNLRDRLTHLKDQHEVNMWLEERQQNLRERLVFLKHEHPQMAQIVASRWPEGVPNIRMPLTSDDLDRIEAIVIEAERQVEAPFDPPISVSEALPSGSPPATPEPPALGTIDEGPNMEPADIEAFKGAFAALDNELQIRIDSWAREAQEATVSISMRSMPSKRRFSIGRFCLLACHHHEDVVRAVLALVLGDETIQPIVTTGSVLGVLTQAEAEKAWEIVLAVDGGAYTVTHWPNGQVKLVAA